MAARWSFYLLSASAAFDELKQTGFKLAVLQEQTFVV
jgi:hypothetical protein